jgi:3-hydroxyanthranilate 3,4-dioxygenase
MCLKIVENGKHKDIVIKEGELFLLPARIPHSPQRTANSVGLVIERRRDSDEMDGVRYFIQPDTTQTLYEKWFHCYDLGVQLIPLIKEFFQSDEYKTNEPKDNVCDKIPFELNTCLIDPVQHGPFNLTSRIEQNDNNFQSLTPPELKLQFEVLVLKKGVHKLSICDGNNTWLWQLKGSSSLKLISNENNETSITFKQNDSLLISDSEYKEKVVVINDETAYMISVNQNPKLK